MAYVLIIGAKSDIAKALAVRYAAEGNDLYLAARSANALSEFASDTRIRAQVEVKCVELDIEDYASHASFYDSLEEKPLGVISVVGYLGTQERAQNEFEETERIISANYSGVVSLLNIVANHFEERKSGFIVGVSSVAGDRGRKSNYIYGSAKGGLTTYLSGLRNRLHASGVTVLTVKPGFVATRMTKGMDLPEALVAQPEDVAAGVLRAQRKGKDVVYTSWVWRWIMLVIKAIPEKWFKRMSF